MLLETFKMGHRTNRAFPVFLRQDGTRVWNWGVLSSDSKAEHFLVHDFLSLSETQFSHMGNGRKTV